MNDLQKRIIERVRLGVTKIRAAKIEGLDAVWLAEQMRIAEFARAVGIAETHAAMELQSLVADGVAGWPIAALALTRRYPRSYGGRDALLELTDRVADGAPKWAAAAWLLAVRWPKSWGRCREEFRKPDRSGPKAKSIDLAGTIGAIARVGGGEHAGL